MLRRSIPRARPERRRALARAAGELPELEPPATAGRVHAEAVREPADDVKAEVVVRRWRGAPLGPLARRAVILDGRRHHAARARNPQLEGLPGAGLRHTDGARHELAHAQRD